MRRRSFLQSLLAAGALSGAGWLPQRDAIASPFTPAYPRTLVSVLLEGGPDLRHLMPPVFSETVGSYAHEYWRATAASHGVDDSVSALQARFNAHYDVVGNDTHEFGLLRSCGWLKRMWDQGDVAIIHNVLGSSSRNHPLSVLANELGNRALTSPTTQAPGVGGRLADLSGTNVVSLTPAPRGYCYGPEASGLKRRSTERLISARDTRALTLFEGDATEPANTVRNEISRNVAAYYAALQGAVADAAQAKRFLTHEQKLRALGGPIAERLNNVPVPAELARLYDQDALPLFSPAFGLQVRNLYDTLACADILNAGIATLEYKGFDTHRLQAESLEPRLVDLFGDGQALDSLFNALPETVKDQLVLVLCGEFGRQIRANGDGGTDHGEGGTVLVIGRPVSGGVYGDPFPEAELARLDDPSPQITGATAIERVHAALADWHTPGAGVALFPELAQTPLETGVQLNLLVGAV